VRVHDHLRIQRDGEHLRLIVRRTQVNEALIAVILVIGLGWIPIALILQANSNAFRVAASVVISLALVSGAFLAARRAFRIRAEVSTDGVRVFNYWRTFEFAWSDVREVGMSSINQGVLPQPAVAFRLVNGQTVAVLGTPRNDEQRRRFISELQASAPPDMRGMFQQAPPWSPLF
jgi:hypothetical protein